MFLERKEAYQVILNLALKIPNKLPIINELTKMLDEILSEERKTASSCIFNIGIWVEDISEIVSPLLNILHDETKNREIKSEVSNILLRFINSQAIKLSDIKINDFELILNYVSDLKPEMMVSKMEKIPLFSKIYNHEKLGEKTPEEKYSISLSVYRYLGEISQKLDLSLMDFDEAMDYFSVDAETKRVNHGIDHILTKREGFESKIILGQDTYLITFVHQDKGIKNQPIKDFAKNRGVINIIEENLKGPEDKENIKRIIINSKDKRKTTIWVNAHGSYNYICLGGGVPSQQTEQQEIECEGFRYNEFADILLERGNLQEVILMIDSCFSYNFAEQLINNLKEKRTTFYPTIITASNKGKVSYAYRGTSVLLSSIKSVNYDPLNSQKYDLLGKHIYEAEKHSFYWQDFAVFFSEDGTTKPLEISMSSPTHDECYECEGDNCFIDGYASAEQTLIPQPERYSLISDEEATQTVLDATSYASAGISDVENSLVTETIVAINFWEKALEEWNKEYKTDYENWGDIQDMTEKEKVFDLMIVGIVNAETSYNKNNILAELFLYKMRSLGYGASNKYEQAIKAVENSEQLAEIEKWGVETGEEYVEAWEVEIILEKELKDFKLNLKQSTKDLLLDSLLKEPITKNIISSLGISGEEKISLILEFYVNAGFNKEEIINLLKKNEIETLVNIVENVNLLKHKDSRKGATLFFENISSNIEDATPLIPTINPLIYVLDDYYSFGNVRKTLNYLAENLEDKSLVITPLIKALKDDDLRIYAGFTLGDIALNIEETSIIINPLIESLKHKNSRKGATYALKEIADNLEDIAPLIPAINPIIEVLQYEDSREDATVAFRYIAPKLEGKDIREGFTIDFSNTLNKIYSQEQTKFFSRQLAVLINKMHDDEINNFGTDYIRETIAQNLNTRSIYYLISIGGADLYTSTFGKLYENMCNVPDYRQDIKCNNPNLIDEIKAIPDYENYFVDFIIRLANFNKLKNVISLDEEFFYSGIEQALQEQNEDTLIRNGALLVSTFEDIFSGELGINAEKYENLLLDLYTEKDKTKQGVLGFLIKLNCDKFVCKTESMEISSRLPEISRLSVPQEWMNDGLITAKLYFFDDEEWFGITRTWLKQSGFTESDIKKQGDKLIESSLTKNKRKIIIHLMEAYNTNNMDVELALKNPEIDIIMHRGHSYHLYENPKDPANEVTFIQEHSNSDINKLLYLGSCGSFGSTSLLQKWFPNAYFISDEDTGRGADNHRLLLLLMEKIANGEREWIEITNEINVKVEGVTGIVYPDDKSMLLRRFINNL